jgi:hypothetical protein
MLRVEEKAKQAGSKKRRLIAVWVSVVCCVYSKILGLKMNASKFPQNFIYVGTSQYCPTSEFRQVSSD